MAKPASSPRSSRGTATRERLLGAALAEFQRNGMAGADTTAIVAAAGVAHGTFFFHFPTKEHVLIELELREENRMATELERFFAGSHTVRDTLAECVRTLERLEQRLGARLFKDFLALHFSTTRPPSEEWAHHPVIVAVITELQRARDRGEIPADVDVIHVGASFLAGLYALMITIHDDPKLRRPMLDEYITTYTFGLRTVCACGRDDALCTAAGPMHKR
jgi:AcrR family transcriptional regulator